MISILFFSCNIDIDPGFNFFPTKMLLYLAIYIFVWDLLMKSLKLQKCIGADYFATQGMALHK